MTTSRRFFSLCSLLMSNLFALSAYVQLNDPGSKFLKPAFLFFIGIDWYFWFPLYSCASIVNLTNCIISAKLIRQIGTITLFLGILLFVKVVLEDFVYGIVGFWSLDLSERVVREKTGSILVVISTILQMEASKFQNGPVKKSEKKLSNMLKYGMLILVVISYLLPFVFFVVLKGETKF